MEIKITKNDLYEKTDDIDLLFSRYIPELLSLAQNKDILWYRIEQIEQILKENNLL